MVFLLDVLHCCLFLSGHYAEFTVLADLLLDLGLLLLLVLLLLLFTGGLELNYICIDILDWDLYEIVRRALSFTIIFYHEYVMVIFRILKLIFLVLFSVSIEYFILQLVSFINLF